MNYWFWLFIVAAPLIVFSLTPDANPWWRVYRLLLAVGVVYVFINLALHLSVDRGWQAYESCRITHSGHDGPYETRLGDRLDRICPAAPHSGPPEVFYLLFGWAPAAAYVGFFELLWRWQHRTTIRTLGNAFKGKWVSTALIVFSTPVWLYILVLLAVLIYTAGCNWYFPNGGNWYGPNNKCWLGG